MQSCQAPLAYLSPPLSWAMMEGTATVFHVFFLPPSFSSSPPSSSSRGGMEALRLMWPTSISSFCWISTSQKNKKKKKKREALLAIDRGTSDLQRRNFLERQGGGGAGGGNKSGNQRRRAEIKPAQRLIWSPPVGSLMLVALVRSVEAWGGARIEPGRRSRGD